MSSPQLGWVIARSLADAGVREVVVCPGSRSTAIAVALAGEAAAGRIRLHTRTDERVGAFVALGLARATGSAAIVVTSGTAVGNLMPAVMEAWHSGVALVVVTADRPATLLGSGANQTTRQVGIFGRHVVDDIQLASTDGSPKAWFAGMGRVLVAATGVRTNRPGPVHVNAAFTEPFLAGPADRVPAQPAPPPLLASGHRAAEPLQLPAGPRTVVLAGDAPAATGRAARRVAEAAGVPLLAEPSSNARAGHCAIAGYRALLDEDLGARIERVLLFGHPTLSRPVTRLLSRDDVTVVAVGERADWPDPGWQVRVVADAVELPPADPGWLAQWRAADRPTEPAGAQATVLTGPQLAAEVVGTANGNLFLGSSNPIRDADRAPIAAHPARCWANRGLSGIDGIMSTAIGVALGTGEPTTVLLGDLSFLHDLGALHLPVSQPVPDLRVVVADDDGGGIFRGLEVAGDGAGWFEPLFVMPHGRDLAQVAAGFGWPTTRVGDVAELRRLVGAPVHGIELVIVPIGS